MNDSEELRPIIEREMAEDESPLNLGGKSSHRAPAIRRVADGGQAFPSSIRDSHGIRWHNGMTLRDYFAGQALAGAMAAMGSYQRESNETTRDTGRILVDTAYEIADAMLAERAEGSAE